GPFAIDFTEADPVDFHVFNNASQRVARHRDLLPHIEIFLLAISQINRVHYAAEAICVGEICRAVLSRDRPGPGRNILFESIALHIFSEGLETLREGFKGIDLRAMVCSVACEDPLVCSDIDDNVIWSNLHSGHVIITPVPNLGENRGGWSRAGAAYATAPIGELEPPIGVQMTCKPQTSRIAVSSPGG